MKTTEFKPEECIEIDGVTFTPAMRATLKRWYDAPDYDNTVPERFFMEMSHMQDYLSRLIADASFDEDMRKEINLMAVAIEIKDDMQIFADNRVRKEGGQK